MVANLRSKDTMSLIKIVNAKMVLDEDPIELFEEIETLKQRTDSSLQLGTLTKTKFQLKKSIISGDKHAEMIATLDQLEFAGLRNNRSPDSKAAYMKIGTGSSESLKEKHIQIEFLEYLAAEGLLEKFR
ncbi:MAG: hypothetical protein Q9206_003285 [Seirophora lacunosa]